MDEWGPMRERRNVEIRGQTRKKQEGFSFLFSCFIINFHSILIRSPVIYAHTQQIDTHTDTFRLRQTHLYAQVSFAACSTTYLCVYIRYLLPARLFDIQSPVVHAHND